jgi:hypothetical protein
MRGVAEKQQLAQRKYNLAVFIRSILQITSNILETPLSPPYR